MIIFPAIDIMDGKPVRLLRGDFDTAEQVAEDVKNSKDKILAIAHCNCRDRAEAVKNMILEKITVKDVIILDTAGISSMYAADGGVIVVV